MNLTKLFIQFFLLLQPTPRQGLPEAAVALVVGKYLVGYTMEIEELSIKLQMKSQVLVKKINPLQAKNYYLRRISLEAYLESLTSGL